jgi:inorganic pyrophosphatase
LLRFFHVYARCKALRNALKRRPGRNACEGWCDAAEAIGRARPLVDTAWTGPYVPY